ncbi:hypothetical protein SAMN06295974_1555 [Plantibacter flavus]|uniref:Uncharacterized protein n=1 Tax=Plantibacter flavus TaxID=150123 RepID=A0A3N2C7N8_9MICO|nr:hypothetical protein EDD42_3598 [Plantibacter flavus]SMG24048.1 hypothetical protein SAMN06295974_1555 [Plantibacter flavus]
MESIKRFFDERAGTGHRQTNVRAPRVAAVMPGRPKILPGYQSHAGVAPRTSCHRLTVPDLVPEEHSGSRRSVALDVLKDGVRSVERVAISLANPFDVPLVCVQSRGGPQIRQWGRATDVRTRTYEAVNDMPVAGDPPDSQTGCTRPLRQRVHDHHVAEQILARGRSETRSDSEGACRRLIAVDFAVALVDDKQISVSPRVFDCTAESLLVSDRPLRVARRAQVCEGDSLGDPDRQHVGSGKIPIRRVGCQRQHGESRKCRSGAVRCVVGRGHHHEVPPTSRPFNCQCQLEECFAGSGRRDHCGAVHSLPRDAEAPLSPVDDRIVEPRGAAVRWIRAE